MIVKLLASYFKSAHFHDINDCPLARAIKAQGQYVHVEVGIYRTYINMEKHFHEGYHPESFEDDHKIARRANFDDTVIREIELVKY